MRWLLLAGLLLPVRAGAQILPQASSDTVNSENFEYLAAEIRKVAAAQAAADSAVANSTCVYINPSASVPVTTEPNVFHATATITISNNSRIRMWANAHHGGNTTTPNTKFWVNNVSRPEIGSPSCIGIPAAASTLGSFICDRMTEPLSSGTYNIGVAFGLNGGSADTLYNGYGSFRPFLCAMEIKTQ